MRSMYKKENGPEVGNLVICTVKKVTPHAAFVELDEYEKEAMLHISEVASKWVKRIRDYVNVNSRVVCKVISIRNGMIDVSLRRVSSGERKRKINEWRMENRLYNLINALSKVKRKTTTEKIIKQIVDEFGSLREFFLEYKENKDVMNSLKVPKTWKTKLSKMFDEIIKTSMVEIKREIKLNSYESNGIKRIKGLLEKIKKIGKESGYKINILYIGTPRYLLKYESRDYKTGEKFFSSTIKEIEKYAKKEKVEMKCKDI